MQLVLLYKQYRKSNTLDINKPLPTNQRVIQTVETLQKNIVKSKNKPTFAVPSPVSNTRSVDTFSYGMLDRLNGTATNCSSCGK
jgi:hypothetical protein